MMDIKFKGGYSRMTGCTMGNHPEYDRGFRNGQQSKQADIDALKDKINRALKALEKLDGYDYNEDLDSVFLILGE